MTDDFYDIIAIRFHDDMIHLGQKAIEKLLAVGNYVQLISRDEFKLLGRMDLDEKYGLYAEHAPTLFRLPIDCEFSIRMPHRSCML